MKSSRRKNRLKSYTELKSCITADLTSVNKSHIIRPVERVSNDTLFTLFGLSRKRRKGGTYEEIHKKIKEELILWLKENIWVKKEY